MLEYRVFFKVLRYVVGSWDYMFRLLILQIHRLCSLRRKWRVWTLDVDYTMGEEMGKIIYLQKNSFWTTFAIAVCVDVCDILRDYLNHVGLSSN